MPDITMCNDHECRLASRCYRHEAKLSDCWQSWFVETPRQADGCAMFWPLERRLGPLQVRLSKESLP